MSNAPVNKVQIAKFLRGQSIPDREAIFAAVMLGDLGIDVHRVADAFAAVTSDTGKVLEILLAAEQKAIG